MAFASLRLSSHMHWCIGIGCSLIAGGTWAKHTLGLNYYRKLLALYKDGKPVSPPQHLMELKEQVAMDMNLDPSLESDMVIFMAHGQDPVHKGSTNLRTSAIIGLPANFAYNTTSDVESSNIQISGKEIDLTSVSGSEFVNSLVLNNDGKRFAIAREIMYCKQSHVIVIGTMQGVFGCGAYITGAFLNKSFHLKTRMKTWARLIMYSVITAMWAFGYVTLKDTYQCFRDIKVDEKTGLIGYSYAVGGIEYYSKMLQRNQAIRKLMGREGEVMYTVYGNNTQGWRQRNIQLTHRLDAMQKMVDGYDSGEIKAKPHREKKTLLSKLKWR